MKIIESYIDIGKESRPGDKLHGVDAIVMHWTAKKGQTAEDVRKWFDNDVNGVYGSAHEIIDIYGNVLVVIPDNEIAFHVGSNNYTEFARTFFRTQYTKNRPLTPNFVTIGIEMIPIDTEGNFSDLTYDAAIKRVIYHLKKNKLTVDNGLLMHSHIRPINEKACPRRWALDPAEWELFKLRVKKELI